MNDAISSDAPTNHPLARRQDLREARLRLGAKIETAVRDLKIWLGSVMVVALGVILIAIRYLPAGNP